MSNNNLVLEPREYYTKTGITLTVIQGGLSLTNDFKINEHYEVLVECTANGSRGVHTVNASNEDEAKTTIERLLSKAYHVVGVK